MITLKKLTFLLLAGITCIVGFELGERLSIPGVESFVPTIDLAER